MKKVSPKTIGRLSLYRFQLDNMRQSGVVRVFSHELASAANCSAAQVRRDLMSIAYTGTPVHGYQVAELIDGLDKFLDDPLGRNVALVGVGHLGRAIMAYLQGRRPNLTITAAFDVNENKTNRIIDGCRCYPIEQLNSIIKEKNILVGILAVPVGAAQDVADQLVDAGVKGLLNFAPVRLVVPHDVFIEDVDLTVCLEKVAYFSRLRSGM